MQWNEITYEYMNYIFAKKKNYKRHFNLKHNFEWHHSTSFICFAAVDKTLLLCFFMTLPDYWLIRIEILL